MPRGGSFPGERRGGRRAGTPNRINRDLKEMILSALTDAGGAAYLTRQAEACPAAFMALVGKVLPLQVAGEGGGPIHYSFQWAAAATASPQHEPEVAGLIAAAEDDC
jgi:hypothetical protein